MPDSTTKKLDELYELIDDMQIALLTTRRPDGRLVTRPMDTQEREPDADLWFVTDADAHKVDELENDPNVCVAYYDSGSREWVSVSGTATMSQDRKKIHELYDVSWKPWFPDEGGERDGGPDDPRLALIFVEAHTVAYMKAEHSKPRMLFELAKSVVTGQEPDGARVERLSEADLNR